MIALMVVMEFRVPVFDVDEAPVRRDFDVLVQTRFGVAIDKHDNASDGWSGLFDCHVLIPGAALV
jgi:hypothetical protein